MINGVYAGKCFTKGYVGHISTSVDGYIFVVDILSRHVHVGPNRTPNTAAIVEDLEQWMRL